ncbi:MAG: response regulator transcription factor [Nitrospirae bacterium]|nr:response regulator transcription factor [Nitrospirota bacterium]
MGVSINQTVLIIDDEVKVLDIVSAYLKREGFNIVSAQNGKDGLFLFKSNPDIVILDLMLPDMEGEDICRIIREDSDVPIIMLTAKTVIDDRVKGLLLGADDYIVKPFSPKELVARVIAILRRVKRKGNVLSFNSGRLLIDKDTNEVKVDRTSISLTNTEFRLLATMAERHGNVLTRLQIMNLVYGYDSESYDRTIDVHIKNLRKILCAAPNSPEFIKTIYGAGYKFIGVIDQE